MKMAEAEFSTGDESGDETIGSHEKANNNYGQNGYQGPPSDLPGQHTTSDFLPQTVLPPRSADGTPDWQNRKLDNVGKSAVVPAAYGMKARDDKIDFPVENVRRATKAVASKSFQR
jgi:hypothetical protein